MPRSERRSSRRLCDAVGAVVEAHPVVAGRRGQERGRAVGEEEDVGVDAIRAGLAEGEDADGHPRVGRRDADVDGRAVADGLAAIGGGVGVEHGGEEDRAALGVEVEDFGRVRREAEAVLPGPTCRRPRSRP